MVRRSAAAAATMGSAGHHHHVVPAEGNNNALALVPVPAAGGGGGGPKEPAGLPCPRCDSTDTKFCYYNNYNLGQPRHFCKGCRRYWTRGGAIRNVPVGGGTRKATLASASRRKRSGGGASSSTPLAPALMPTMVAAASSPAPLAMSAPGAYAAAVRPYDLPLPPFIPSPSSMSLDRRLLLRHDRRLTTMEPPDRRLLDLGGSFTSLLAPAAAPVDAHFSSSGPFLVGGFAPAVAPPPPPAAAAASAPALLPPHQHPPAVSSQVLPEGFIWSMGWPDLST